MSSLPPWIREHPQGCQLLIWVQPKSSRTQIDGTQEDRLKIRLQAPPVDGQANQALLKFLAKTLEVRPSSLQLSRGETGRKKTVVLTMVLEQVLERLQSSLPDSSEA